MFSFGGKNSGAAGQGAKPAGGFARPANTRGGGFAASGGGFGSSAAGFGASSSSSSSSSSSPARGGGGGSGFGTFGAQSAGAAGGFGKAASSGFRKSPAPGGGFAATSSAGFGNVNRGFGNNKAAQSSSTKTTGFGAASQNQTTFGFGNNRAPKRSPSLSGNNAAGGGFGRGFTAAAGGGGNAMNKSFNAPSGFGRTQSSGSSGGFGFGSASSGGGAGFGSGTAKNSATSPAGFGSRSGFSGASASSPGLKRNSSGFGRAGGIGAQSGASPSSSSSPASAAGKGVTSFRSHTGPSKSTGFFGAGGATTVAFGGFGAGVAGRASSPSAPSSSLKTSGFAGGGGKSSASSSFGDGGGSKSGFGGFGSFGGGGGASAQTNKSKSVRFGQNAQASASGGARPAQSSTSSKSGGGASSNPGAGFGSATKPVFGGGGGSSNSSGFAKRQHEGANAFGGNSSASSGGFNYGGASATGNGATTQMDQSWAQDAEKKDESRSRRKRDVGAPESSSQSSKSGPRKEVCLALSGAPVDEDVLFEHFSQFGPVEFVQVHAGQGDAHLVMGNAGAASKVVRKGVHKMGGAIAKARFGTPGLPRSTKNVASAISDGGGGGGGSSSSNNKTRDQKKGPASSATSAKIADIVQKDKEKKHAIMRQRIAELEQNKPNQPQRQQQQQQQQKQQQLLSGSAATRSGSVLPAADLASLDSKKKKRQRQARNALSDRRAHSSSFSAASSDGAEDEREDDDDDDEDADEDGGSDDRIARRRRAERFKLARPVSSSSSQVPSSSSSSSSSSTSQASSTASQVSANPSRPPNTDATPQTAGRAFKMGQCTRMCPKSETDRRYHENALHLLERQHREMPELPSKYDLTVKSFMRSSAGMVLDNPKIVRTEAALVRTIDYLWDDILDRPERGPDPRFRDSSLYRAGDGVTPTPAFVISFLQDRTRSVRKDFSIQGFLDENGSLSADCVRVFEECARMHIMVDEQLCQVSKAEGHDEILNRQEANNCLKALNDMYARARAMDPQTPQDESRKAHILRREAEFQAYYILMQASDAFTVGVFIRDLPQALRQTSWVRIALQVARALYRCDYVSFFRLLRAPTTPYLVGCLMHGLFERVWRDALMVLNFATMRGGDDPDKHYTYQDLADMLCFENAEHARAFCQYVGLASSSQKEPNIVLFGVVRTLARPDMGFPRRVSKLVENKRFDGAVRAHFPPRRQIVRGLDALHQRLNQADDTLASTTTSASASRSAPSSIFQQQTPTMTRAAPNSGPTSRASTVFSSGVSGTVTSNSAPTASNGFSFSSAPPAPSGIGGVTPFASSSSSSSSASSSSSSFASGISSSHGTSSASPKPPASEEKSVSVPSSGISPFSAPQTATTDSGFATPQDASPRPTLKRQASSLTPRQQQRQEGGHSGSSTQEFMGTQHSFAADADRARRGEPEMERQQREREGAQQEAQREQLELARHETRERDRAKAAREAEQARLEREERLRQEREAKAAREAALRARLQAEEQERMRKEAEDAARAEAEAKRARQRGREQEAKALMAAEDRRSREVEKAWRREQTARRDRLAPVWAAWTRWTRLSAAAKSRARAFRASLKPTLRDGAFRRPTTSRAESVAPDATDAILAAGAPPFAPVPRAFGPPALEVDSLVQLVASADAAVEPFITWKLCLLTENDASSALLATWVRDRLSGPGHVHGTSTLASFQAPDPAGGRTVHIAIKTCSLDEPEEARGADALCVLVPHPRARSADTWDAYRSALTRARKFASAECAVGALVGAEVSDRSTHYVSAADQERVRDLLGEPEDSSVKSVSCREGRLLADPEALCAGDLDALLRWIVEEAPKEFPRVAAMLEAPALGAEWEREIESQANELTAHERKLCARNAALAPRSLKCWLAKVLLTAFTDSQADAERAEDLFAAYAVSDDAAMHPSQFWNARVVDDALEALCVVKQDRHASMVATSSVRDIVRSEDVAYPQPRKTDEMDTAAALARQAAADWVAAFNAYLESDVIPRVRATEKATWPAPEFFRAFRLPSDWNDTGVVDAACEAVKRCTLVPPRQGAEGGDVAALKDEMVHFVQANAMEALSRRQILDFMNQAIGSSVLANLALLHQDELTLIWQVLIDRILDQKRAHPACEALVCEVSRGEPVGTSSLILRAGSPKRVRDFAGTIEPVPKRTRTSPFRPPRLRREDDPMEEDQRADALPAIVGALVRPIQEMSSSFHKEWELKDKVLSELAEEGDDLMQADAAWLRGMNSTEFSSRALEMQ